MTDPGAAVLITGASTGIGEGCAHHLARRGHRVFAGVRTVADGERLQSASAGAIVPLLLDVTDEPQIAAAAARIQTEVGDAGLWGLINNAGIAVPGPVELLPIAELRKQLEINTVGQIAVTQAMLPLLRQSRSPATIINMSSISGRIAAPVLGAYAASKFALEALSDALRVELRPWGIRVVLVEPGAIATPIWRKTLDAGSAILNDLPAEKRQLYQPLVDFVRDRTDPERGIPVQAVVDVVERALHAQKPRARYVVGRSTRVTLWLNRIPTRLRDRLIAQRLPAYGSDG